MAVNQVGVVFTEAELAAIERVKVRLDTTKTATAVRYIVRRYDKLFSQVDIQAARPGNGNEAQ